MRFSDHPDTDKVGILIAELADALTAQVLNEFPDSPLTRHAIESVECGESEDAIYTALMCAVSSRLAIGEKLRDQVRALFGNDPEYQTLIEQLA
ncbi:MAG: hypothetical protein ACOX61_11610 [Brooklawnia sp.]